MALENVSAKQMEGILALLDAKKCMELAFISPKMWKIVEKTPKKYGIVQFCDSSDDWHDELLLMFLGNDDAKSEGEGACIRMPLSLPLWVTTPGLVPLWLIEELRHKDPVYVRSAFLRLFLTNATIKELRSPMAMFGNEFWFSLNMKVTRIFNPIAVDSSLGLHQFLDHFKPTQFIFQGFHRFLRRVPEECIEFLQSPVIHSLETLYLSIDVANFPLLQGIRAKDLRLVILGKTTSVAEVLQITPISWFVLTKVKSWLEGTNEIDNCQFFDRFYVVTGNAFLSVITGYARVLSPELGWIDRTYGDMSLILRASDGQALLSYWDQDDSCFYLIRCQYNFRRGRCLGSYERNQKSLEMIRGFMHKLQKQNDQIGENPAETTEKLKEECIKFNEYNKGATQLDLLTDSIWRPKGQRYSPWTMNDEKLFDIRPVYPMDARLRDAYKFTKTFEETGLLPDVNQFKPITDELYSKLFI